MARQNYWCCGTCGLYAIDEEMTEAYKNMEEIRGYTFYHEQDTESAVYGYGVSLYYGASLGEKEAALAIGREIVEVMEAHSLTVEWDETWEKRISVKVDWKKRRYDLPVECENAYKSDYLSNLEDYEERLASGEIQW